MDATNSIDTRHTPKSLRARLGLSITEVANRSGVKPRTITYIESGRDAKVSTVERIAVVLQVTTDALIAAISVERERRAAERANAKDGAA